MKRLFYTSILFLSLVAIITSCTNKREPVIVKDDPVIVYDTVYEAASTNVRKERQKVEVVSVDDFHRLKKYSVIVATLTKQKGITALKRFFERDGISHFVVKNPQGLYYFVIYSSDYEQDAIDARANFLLDNTVNKSREDLWRQYYISMTDAFILQKE